jgi:hypothetical protein
MDEERFDVKAMRAKADFDRESAFFIDKFMDKKD